MATGAVLNACWDLAARRAGQPLWLLLAGLSPEEITGLVDFRYLSDALTPDEALGLLERGAAGRAERIAALRRNGYPAYSTAPGWLGYSDQRLAALCAEAVGQGFTQVKLKVGAALEDDKRRCAIAREVLGGDFGKLGAPCIQRSTHAVELGAVLVDGTKRFLQRFDFRERDFNFSRD